MILTPLGLILISSPRTETLDLPNSQRDSVYKPKHSRVQHVCLYQSFPCLSISTTSLPYSRIFSSASLGKPWLAESPEKIVAVPVVFFL